MSNALQLRPLAACVAAVLALALAGCGKQTPVKSAEAAKAAPQPAPDPLLVTTTPELASRLQIGNPRACAR